MSEIIRLTESDLVTIVKKVINEQRSDYAIDRQSNSIMNAAGIRSDKNYKQVNKMIDSLSPQQKTVLQKVTLEQFVSGFRDVISGVGGTIAQIIIAGLGGHVVNMVAWGLLVAYDIYSWASKGTADWFNLLHDLFWLLLSGAGGKVMGALKPLIKGESKLLNVFAKLSKTNSWGYIKSILSKISTYGGKIISKISQALKYIISKLPSLKTLLNPLLGVVNRVGGVLKTIENTFVQYTKLSVKKGTTQYVKSNVQGQVLNTTVGQLK